MIQELIQKDATPEKLAAEIEKLMNIGNRTDSGYAAHYHHA